MTPEQRRRRAMVMGGNGPIRIHCGKRAICPCDDYETQSCDSCKFLLAVARAAGNERLFEERRYRKEWFFWYQMPANLFDPQSRPYENLYTFRTFREACNKVKEIFSDGGK